MRRVFILSRHTMFSRGIETLLSQSAEVEIVGRDTELKDALGCIQQNRPDVVVVNCDEPDPELTSAVLGILRDQLGICVIGLSLCHNQLNIYRGEQKQVRQVQDLLEAIQD